MIPRLYEVAAFMMKRHLIYLKRKAGQPGPWTTDPILLNGRFCNIYRELDTVTQWIDKHIRQPYADHEHLWFMLCIARYINWPPTLEKLIEISGEGPATWPDNPRFHCGEFEKIGKPNAEGVYQRVAALPRDGFDSSTLTWALHQIAKTGEKVYTGAYMIRAESDPNKHWYKWSKHKYIAEIVLGRLWEDREQWRATLEDQSEDEPLALRTVWERFQDKRYVGWGPFMAYEVVTDLRHTRYLKDAPDIYTWANAGPGAIRGLNRVFGRPLKVKPKEEQTRQEMFDLMVELNDRDGRHFNEVFGLFVNTGLPPRFEMRDVEHTLCEFDKYERVRLGEGKMRSKYDWQKATEL